jgi:cytochrome c oxidase subunit 2
MSADTDHSFWIPQLGGKTDLIPNRVNEMWIDPTRRASFSASARSTAGPARQDASARVGGQSRRLRRLGPRAAAAATPSDETAAAGACFETTACMNCHAIGGTAANGRFGPDLTHLMSRRPSRPGGGEHDENLRLWIENPDAIKPGSLMPPMKVSDADLDALVRYLETLR